MIDLVIARQKSVIVMDIMKTVLIKHGVRYDPRSIGLNWLVPIFKYSFN